MMANDQDWLERARMTGALKGINVFLARLGRDEAVRWTLGVFLLVRVGLSVLALVVITLRPLPEGGHQLYLASPGLDPVSRRAEELLLEVRRRWDVMHTRGLRVRAT